MRINDQRRTGPAATQKALLGRVDIDWAIFGSILTLMALAALPIVAVDQRWDAVFDAAMLLLGFSWIIFTLTSKHLSVHPALVPIVGLILLACIQLLPVYRVSVDPFETRRFAIRAAAFGLTLAMLLHYTASRKQLLTLAHFVVLVGTVSAGVGLLLKLAPDALGSQLSENLGRDSFGQFENRNHFALLMEMSLGPALGLTLFAGWRTLALLYGAVALLLCAALVLTTSRGGILSMLGQLMFFSWGSFPSSQLSSVSRVSSRQHRFWRRSEAVARRFVLTVLLLGIASWGVLWLGGEPLRRRIDKFPREFSTRSSTPYAHPNRLEIWTTTGKLIAAHPVLGSGLGAYRTAIRDFFPTYIALPQFAHNEYLELLAGGGIVGAPFGVWFLLIIIKTGRQGLRQTDSLSHRLCFGALVGLLGIAIHSLVDFGLHVTVNALVCCSLIAIACHRYAGKHQPPMPQTTS